MSWAKQLGGVVGVAIFSEIMADSDPTAIRSGKSVGLATLFPQYPSSWPTLSPVSSRQNLRWHSSFFLATNFGFISPCYGPPSIGRLWMGMCETSARAAVSIADNAGRDIMCRGISGW
jgi:hypothetical protein